MKLLGFLSLMILNVIVVYSCQREFSLENAKTSISTGTLKTVSGDCMPSGSGGTFRKGVEVDSSNYIFVEISVFSLGSYLVVSDTVNRVSFKGEGFFETTGNHTVRLNASGAPFTNGTVPYSIKYGSQKCIVNVFAVQ